MIPSASAHGGDPTTEGYLIVQQALGYLANEPGENGTTGALMKIDEALAVTDQEGVAVPQLQQAKTALEAGKRDDGRALLQGSITEALAAQKPATGEETGTTVMADPVSGRGPLTGGDWALLGLSLLVALAGLTLAVVLRPHQSLGDLRKLLSPRALAKTTPAFPPEQRHDGGH